MVEQMHNASVKIVIKSHNNSVKIQVLLAYVYMYAWMDREFTLYTLYIYPLKVSLFS